MKKTNKNNNALTININDELKNEVQFLADYYQRKPAELLRLLLAPVLQAEFIKAMNAIHEGNTNAMQPAIFKK